MKEGGREGRKEARKKGTGAPVRERPGDQNFADGTQRSIFSSTSRNNEGGRETLVGRSQWEGGREGSLCSFADRRANFEGFDALDLVLCVVCFVYFLLCIAACRIALKRKNEKEDFIQTDRQDRDVRCLF